MIRLGLCCLFKNEPVQFRTVTAKALEGLDRQEQLKRISTICLGNVISLLDALHSCSRLGIRAFRIMSPLFPRATHPQVGYSLPDLPDVAEIDSYLVSIRKYRANHDIRLSFHPDQFVVISSPRDIVNENSNRELSYQGMLAELTGAEVINMHGGGGYGDKAAALQRFAENFTSLPDTVRSRLTLENDDKIYTVLDLIPICRKLGIPLVYDVHHHRCNPDGLSIEEATSLAVETWLQAGREPFFHVSSPRSGWHDGDPKPHADYIDANDFPVEWLGLTCTVDVEAKAKELAVLRLRAELGLDQT